MGCGGWRCAHAQQRLPPTTAGGAGFKVDPIDTGAAVIRLELKRAGLDTRSYPTSLFSDLAAHCLRRAERIAAGSPGASVAGRYASALEAMAEEVEASIRRETRPS